MAAPVPMPAARDCARPHCACGTCYSPGSLVGDWVRRHALRAWRGVRRLVLGRREQYGPDGGLLVPAWVVEMLDGGLLAEERRLRG